MKLLALDTACSSCSVAIWDDGAIAAARTEIMKQGHAEALLPMVLEIVRDASVPFAALDLVAVTLGPGSFTGLRTGLAAAKGIALAHDLPIVGVTSLEAVAHAAAHAARLAASPQSASLPITAVLETRRGSVYLQSFAADGTKLNDPCSVTLEDAVAAMPENGTVLAGDAASRIVLAMGISGNTENIMLIDTITGPDARIVAEIAAGRWAAGDDAGMTNNRARPLVPLYVQPPEAKRPVNGGRLRS